MEALRIPVVLAFTLAATSTAAAQAPLDAAASTAEVPPAPPAAPAAAAPSSAAKAE